MTVAESSLDCWLAAAPALRTLRHARESGADWSSSAPLEPSQVWRRAGAQRSGTLRIPQPENGEPLRTGRCTILGDTQMKFVSVPANNPLDASPTKAGTGDDV